MFMRVISSLVNRVLNYEGDLFSPLLGMMAGIMVVTPYSGTGDLNYAVNPLPLPWEGYCLLSIICSINPHSCQMGPEPSRKQ